MLNTKKDIALQSKRERMKGGKNDKQGRESERGLKRKEVRSVSFGC